MVFFMFTHITAIAQASLGITKGFQAQVLDPLRNPFWTGGLYALVFDLIALGIIAFHGLNGIRIVFLDLGYGARRHRLSFWITMLVALAGSTFVIILGLPLLSKGG